MAAWFVVENSAWRRTEHPPTLAPAVLDVTAAGEWLILAPPGTAVAINGIAVQSGIALLQHEDEIASADNTIAYFTAETLPEVVSFSGRAAKCGRDRSVITEGAAAVRCACGVWYHEECFEYGGDDAVCVACGRPTRLDGSGLWRPEW